MTCLQLVGPRDKPLGATSDCFIRPRPTRRLGTLVVDPGFCLPPIAALRLTSSARSLSLEVCKRPRQRLWPYTIAIRGPYPLQPPKHQPHFLRSFPVAACRSPPSSSAPCSSFRSAKPDGKAAISIYVGVRTMTKGNKKNMRIRKYGTKAVWGEVVGASLHVAAAGSSRGEVQPCVRHADGSRDCRLLYGLAASVRYSVC